VGSLKLHELRRRAEAAPGPRFDLAAFHAEVLNDGAVPLDILEEKTDRWIKDQVALTASRRAAGITPTRRERR